MAFIFISYNRKSGAIADTLAHDLEALGHNVWLDRELSGGQTWWDEILGTVRRCDLFVFVLDPEALNSTACMREYGYAGALGKRILPVLVSEGVSENLLPPALHQIQFVDYRAQDRNAVLRLAKAVNTLPPSKPLPDPLPAPPEVPTSYLGDLAAEVETSAPLDFIKQKALVFDLKRELKDPATTDDSRTLLERLRKRPDLYARIAEEVDELLAAKGTPSAGPLRTLETTPISPERWPREEAEVVVSPPPSQTATADKLITRNVPSGGLGGSSSQSPDPSSQAQPPQTAPSIPNYLLLAILTVVCCWPIAIVSIIYAAQVNGKVAAGDIAGAMAASKKAKIWAMIAGGVGFVWWILIILSRAGVR